MNSFVRSLQNREQIYNGLVLKTGGMSISVEIFLQINFTDKSGSSFKDILSALGLIKTTLLLSSQDGSLLFATVLCNFQHVGLLRYILHPINALTHRAYCLRPRRHELTLTTKRDSGNFLRDYYLTLHVF